MAGGCKLLILGILFSCSCPHGVSILFAVCNFLSLYQWKSVILLKIRALRMGPFCTFQALGKILLQKELDQHDSSEATEHTRVRDRNKEEIRYGIKFALYTGPQVVFVGGIEA